MKSISILKHNLMRAAMTLALMVTCATAWADNVSTYYIDENGTRHDVTATVVTTNMESLGTDGETTWYVVNENVFLYDGSNNQTHLHGNVNLILADGCELKPACGSNGSEDGFRGSGNLTLYGQTAGTGTLSCGQEGFMNITGDFTVCSGMVSVSGYRCNAIRVANFTMRGGSISITNNTNNDCGIRATGTVNIYDGSVEAEGTNGIEADIVNIYGGSVTARCNGRNAPGNNYGHAIKCSSTFNFYGGNVTAQSDLYLLEDQTRYGIYANGINLSWTSTADWINSINDGNLDNVICYFFGSGGLTIAPYKPFTDGNNTYTGTFSGEQVEDFKSVTLLQPAVPTFAETGNGTPEHPYTIWNAIGWSQFCDALQDATYNHFSGKTVKLGANISIRQSAGSAGHEFMGTFDGDGKTLTVDITETTTQGTAPFREINGATIRNLVVTGSVDGTTHAAGLVGFARGADASTVNTITNCKVATNVTVTTPNSAGNYHCGGVVGHAFHCTLNMSNTVYCGDITSSGNNYVGGLQGWSDGNTINFSHCLFAGSYSGTASFHPVAVRNKDNATTATVSHVYYTVTPTLTNSSFIAADGTKTISRATTPATIGDQTQSLNFMSTTLYQYGICYNNLYYATIGLPSGGTDIYLIDNADDWLYFCEMLNDNDTWNRFIGKTVKLGANIEVSRMAGADTHDFCGTFDGQNNTLTFTATATDNYLAPFRNVSGTSETNHAVIQNLNVVTNITATDFRHAAGLIAAMYNHVDVANCNVTANITATKGTNNPNDLYPAGLVSQVANGSQLTVSGCTVSGTIATDGKYAAGMVGIVQGSANITNSVSSVTINSSTEGDGTHGGFVASLVSGRQLTIEGCVFNGKIVTTNGTTNCGGFLGHNNTGDSTGATITNCLYAPTADPNTVSTGCATFGRNVSSNLISNCYYTTALGDAQGTQAYSITADDYVTTLANAGTVSNNYTTSGLSFYSTGIKYGDVLYAAENDVVSLILGCTPPAGFTCTGYTATSGNLNGTTLTMPHENVTINVTLEALPAVSYLDASGNTQQCTAYTLLDGTETSLGTADQETWYVADGTINFNQTINVNGVVHLILKDNAVMNVGTEQNPISDSGISAEGPSISIYGQSTGSDIGMLSVYATYCGIYDYDYSGNNNNPNYDYAVTINGGNIFVSASSYGIQSNKVTINGGQVWATAHIYGIASNPNAITLGWTSPYDFIYADAYQGDVIVKSGKAFINNDNPSNNVVTGTVSDYSLINGIFLQPAVAVTLNDGITAGSGIISSGENLYAQAAVDVTVDASSVIAPPGYAVSGITVTPTVTVTDNGNGIYSFTTPAADVTVSATFALQPVSVNYLDADGVQHTVDALPLLGGGATTLAAGWYVVNSNISYTGTVTLVGSGDVKLILADDHTMNVGTSENRIEYGIKTYNNDQTLTIYGQSTGNHMGILSIYTSHYCIYPLALTINGGHVIANADGNYATALRTTYQTITINGGTVEATATGTGAYAIHSGDNFTYAGGTLITNAASENAIKAYHGRYTFTWRNPSDRITIGSTGLYNNSGNATFTNAFTDGTNIYSGTLTGTEAISGLAGKTLYPNCVVMKQVEGYEEGNGGWAFIASPVAGSIAPTEVHNLLGSYDEATGKYDYDLYRFNQSDPNGKEWQNWNATTTENHPDFTSLVNGQGYLYATKETRTLVFAGEYTAATGSVEVPLDYDATAQLKGWNLVGNPFTVSATSSQPYYRMNADGSALNTVTEETSVAAMEGVFVQATAANQAVSFTAQTRGGEKAAIAQANIMVGGNNGAVIDNAIIRFDGGQTLEKFSFREGSTKLYIPQDGKDYAIVTSEGQGEMPLNFKVETDGTYTITVDVDNVELAYLHLIDNMTGADVDLLAANGGDARHGDADAMNRVSTYTFTAKTTDYESRFRLVFSVGVPADGDNEAFAFIDASGNIIVNGTGTLQVIDMTGRIVLSVGGHTRCVPTTGMTAGVYVLRLINGDKVRTQKIVVE